MKDTQSLPSHCGKLRETAGNCGKLQPLYRQSAAAMKQMEKTAARHDKSNNEPVRRRIAAFQASWHVSHVLHRCCCPGRR